MATAFSHELCGGGGEHPVIPMEVGHVQVDGLGDQWTGGYAPPRATQRARLVVTLVKHNTPGTVQLSCSAKVYVGDDKVKEGSEVFMASSACHQVVAGRG